MKCKHFLILLLLNILLLLYLIYENYIFLNNYMSNNLMENRIDIKLTNGHAFEKNVLLNVIQSNNKISIYVILPSKTDYVIQGYGSNHVNAAFNNMIVGRFFNFTDYNEQNKVAVIGKNILYTDIIHRENNQLYVLYNDDYYTVIGIISNDNYPYYNDHVILNLFSLPYEFSSVSIDNSDTINTIADHKLYLIEKSVANDSTNSVVYNIIKDTITDLHICFIAVFAVLTIIFIMTYINHIQDIITYRIIGIKRIHYYFIKQRYVSLLFLVITTLISLCFYELSLVFHDLLIFTLDAFLKILQYNLFIYTVISIFMYIKIKNSYSREDLLDD